MVGELVLNYCIPSVKELRLFKMALSLYKGIVLSSGILLQHARHFGMRI